MGNDDVNWALKNDHIYVHTYMHTFLKASFSALYISYLETSRISSADGSCPMVFL